MQKSTLAKQAPAASSAILYRKQNTEYGIVVHVAPVEISNRLSHHLCTQPVSSGKGFSSFSAYSLFLGAGPRDIREKFLVSLVILFLYVFYFFGKKKLFLFGSTLGSYDMTLSRMVKDETLLIFIFIILVDFSNGLYLSQPSVTTEPGKSLAISCRDTAGQPVTWKGPKGTLSANTKPKIQDTSIGKLLVFSPTRVQDTGNYTCSLMSNKNEFRVFPLIVEDDTDVRHHGRYHENNPSESESEEALIFKDTPDIQRGKEGENITLRCEINKPYKINWIPENGDDSNLGIRYIPIGDGLLIINASRTEDNRTFVCEVLESTTGQVIHKKIKFIVEHEPVPVTYPVDLETGEPPVWEQVDEVYGFLDENVNLTCEVEAEPHPRFEWRNSKGGQKKIGRIISEGTHKSILQLKMTEETVDKYQCTATNKHGRLKKFFNLQIGTRPEPPGKIELVKASSNNAELNVEVPEADEEAIAIGMEPRWLNIFYRNLNSEDWDEQIFKINETFTLTQLNSSTKYEVMAATRNVAGLSSLSNNTYFETKSASSVQINNLSCFFSVALINTIILLTSRLA